MIIQVENRTLILLAQVNNEVTRITDALKSSAKYGKTSIGIELVTGKISYRAPDGYKHEDILLDKEEAELVRSFVVKALQDYNFVVEFENDQFSAVSLKLNKKKENNNG
jgi:hypothetical protein